MRFLRGFLEKTHSDLHILQQLRAGAAFLDQSEQLFAGALQAGQIKRVLVPEIVINQTLIDSAFADIVYRSAGVAVPAEFERRRLQNSGYRQAGLFRLFHKIPPGIKN